MGHQITTRTDRLEGRGPSALVRADVVEYKGRYYAARLIGGAFEALGVHHQEPGGHTDKYDLGDHLHGTIYRPIAPGTTHDELNGAVYAFDNGTAWEFAHCTPEQHRDFAVRCVALARVQFQPLINRALAKRLEATNARARASAMKRADALKAFTAAVAAHVAKTVLAQVLGHYHVSGAATGYRRVVSASIKAVLAAWKTAALTDTTVRARRALIATDAGVVAATLDVQPKLLTRVATAAAAAAAAKAKAKEAEGDGSGS